MAAAPKFDLLAEAAADPEAAKAVFHDKPPDQGERFILQVPLDGNFNPSDDLVAQTGYESSLLLLKATGQVSHEGGKRTDVLEYAIQGAALERYELMSDFGPFEDWSQQNVL